MSHRRKYESFRSERRKFVLKIHNSLFQVHKDKKSFDAKLYACPESIFSEACLSAQWTISGYKEEYDNYTVVAYFKSLTASGRLPKHVVDRIKSSTTGLSAV